MSKIKPSENFLEQRVPATLIAGLIIYSLVCLFVETLPGLSENTRAFLEYSEVIVVILFTCEYIFRLYTSPVRIRYARSFLGIIDLISILPFYIGLLLGFALDLRWLRMIRLVRIFRILKLVRYEQAIKRLFGALQDSKDELVVFVIFSSLIIVLASMGIHYFEREAQPEAYGSLFNCLWWSISTLTTVGYGDIYPVTAGGKIFTTLILLVGLGMIAVPTAIIASALTAVTKEKTTD